MTMQSLRWHPLNPIMQKKLPETAWQWLTYSQSLTTRLQEFTQNRILFCLIQDWTLDEEKWVRKTQWQFEKKCWIEANLFFPESAVNHETKSILQIREKPIGEILFQDAALTRSPFLFYQYDIFWWTRQSVFHFKQQPLTLIETFFPAFFERIMI